MFGLSPTEIIIILAVALIVLGPEQLPKIATQLGKGVRDLQRAANDFKREVNSASEIETPRTPPAATPPLPNSPYPSTAATAPDPADGDVAEHIEYEPPGQDGYPAEDHDEAADAAGAHAAAPTAAAAATPVAPKPVAAAPVAPAAPTAAVAATPALPVVRPAPSTTPYGDLAALAAANAPPGGPAPQPPASPGATSAADRVDPDVLI